MPGWFLEQRTTPATWLVVGRQGRDESGRRGLKCTARCGVQKSPQGCHTSSGAIPKAPGNLHAMCPYTAECWRSSEMAAARPERRRSSRPRIRLEYSNRPVLAAGHADRRPSAMAQGANPTRLRRFRAWPTFARHHSCIRVPFEYGWYRAIIVRSREGVVTTMLFGTAPHAPGCVYLSDMSEMLGRTHRSAPIALVHRTPWPQFAGYGMPCRYDGCAGWRNGARRPPPAD